MLRTAAFILMLFPSAVWAVTPTVLVGGHANPDANCSHNTDITACESDFTALQTVVGYNLGLDSQYYEFDGFSSTSGLEIAAWDINAGRTPMMTWYPHYTGGGCPKYLDITAGTYDTQLTDQATGLAALGAPVLIRFAPAMDSSIHSCAYSHNNPATDYQEFVDAWQHIYTLVHGTASNALFIWSPNVHSFTDNSGNPVNDWQNFYPGDSYIDWIGTQLYNESTTNMGIDTDPIFVTWYDTVSAKSVPLILSETGAIGPDPQTPCTYTIGGTSSPQSHWLYSMKATFRDDFPAMKGIAYFDSMGVGGAYGCNNYLIRGDGLTSFQNMMSHTYFQKLTP